MTIKEILNWSVIELRKKNIQNPIQQSRILLSYLLDKSKEYLVINEDIKLDKHIVDKYSEILKKLSLGYPIQYITNHTEFMKLDFYVNEDVLIPRNDTEILVEEIIQITNNMKDEYNTNELKILDLCTGSGAIGISLRKYLMNVKVYASDISESAIKVANKNAKNSNVQLELIQSDLFEKIEGKFDIIVSNPPYIKTSVISSLNSQVKAEPILALDGGQDGLDVYRKIIQQGENYLNTNGYLCLEIGYDQKEELMRLLNEKNIYTKVYCKKDLSGNNRVIVAKKG